jgi:hypothetical protein
VISKPSEYFNPYAIAAKRGFIYPIPIIDKYVNWTMNVDSRDISNCFPLLGYRNIARKEITIRDIVRMLTSRANKVT